MDPLILFRRDASSRDEFDEARRLLPVTESRTLCRDRLVLGRYSVLPYYRELETDLRHNGCTLVNTSDQHEWIAGFHYYEALREYTFRTWDQATFPRCRHDGPFVVKGRTNSRKHHWNTMMFARTRRDAVDVAGRLLEDPLITQQGVIYREYLPLRTFEVGLNGLPFTNEWRFFYLGRTRLAHGYYWTEAEDVTSPAIDATGLAFADEAAAVVAEHVDFFVLDVGEKEAGGWVLVEVNDAQMSGPSMIDPGTLYSALALALKNRGDFAPSHGS